MKVTNNAPPNTSATQDAKIHDKMQGPTKAARPQTGSLNPAGGASVEISDKARLLQQAAEIASQSPDVHSERVAALKKSITDGTYRVDSEKVAENLIQEHLNSDFGKNNL